MPRAPPAFGSPASKLQPEKRPRCCRWARQGYQTRPGCQSCSAVAIEGARGRTRCARREAWQNEIGPQCRRHAGRGLGTRPAPTLPTPYLEVRGWLRRPMRRRGDRAGEDFLGETADAPHAMAEIAENDLGVRRRRDRTADLREAGRAIATCGFRFPDLRSPKARFGARCAGEGIALGVDLLREAPCRELLLRPASAGLNRRT